MERIPAKDIEVDIEFMSPGDNTGTTGVAG
jgi:hypothetical protein